jgi:hypothetical protein
LQLIANQLEPGALAQTAGSAIPAQQRVDFHRNNLLSSFRATLRAIYPVVERLVGPHFFERAADAFLDAHPTARGDVVLFGEHFADFVETWTSTGEHPYLADLARLEWRIEQSFRAADRESLHLQDLAAVPPHRQEKLTFELHPSCRLLASAWPIQRIWQANQPGAPEGLPVDLSGGGVFLLIRRQQDEVVIEALDGGGFCMLNLLSIGRPFDEACRSAVSAQSDFDLASFMQKHVVAGVFAEFGRQRNRTAAVTTGADDEPSRRRRDQSFNYA